MGDYDGTGPMRIGDAIEHIGFGPFHYRLMALCGMVWMADSMEMMLMSFLLPAVRVAFSLTSTQEAAVGSATFAGMLIGCFFWGIVSDRIGRRTAYMLVSVFTGAAALASAAVNTFVMLVAMRFLVGIGVGGAPTAFSLFVEFCPSAQRGRTLVLLEGFFWALGSICEALLAAAVLGDEPARAGGKWRWLLVWSAAPCLVVACVLLLDTACSPRSDRLVPESAHWLLVNAKPDEAEETLRAAAVANGRPLPEKPQPPTAMQADARRKTLRLLRLPTADAKLAYEPDEAVRQERGKMSLLFTPAMRLSTLLLWGIWFVCVLVYYGFVLVTPAYFSTKSMSVYASSLIGACSELPGLAIAVVLIDRVGRRRTMSLLFGLQCICSAILALGAHLAGGSSSTATALTIIAVMGRASINGAFACVFVYTPEVYPTTVRGLGLGAASACGRIAGVMTPYITSVLGDAETGDVAVPLVIFAAGSALGVVLSANLPYESNGTELRSNAADCTPQGDKSEREGEESLSLLPVETLGASVNA